METNEILKKQILSVVRNQIKDNNPPQTKQALKRLMDLGYSENDSEIFIAQCVAVELFNTFKNEEDFNEKRFIDNLNNLPEYPKG